MLDKSVFEEDFKDGNAYCKKFTTNTFSCDGRTLERVEFKLKYFGLFQTELKREQLVELQNVIDEALKAL